MTLGNPNDGQEQNEQEPAQQSMQGPRAASERDVREAEAKAEDARDRAEQVHEELRAEIEDLEARLEQQNQILEAVDELVNGAYQHVGDLNSEMPPMHPSNREGSETEPSEFKRSEDGQDIPLPWVSGDTDA